MHLTAQQWIGLAMFIISLVCIVTEKQLRYLANRDAHDPAKKELNDERDANAQLAENIMHVANIALGFIFLGSIFFAPPLR